METTNRGYVYPSDYNQNADVPKDMKILAYSIDKDVGDLEKTHNESQAKQDEEITALEQENEMLKNLLPTVSGKGTYLTLKNTGEMPFKKFEIGGNSYQFTQEQGKNILDLTKLSQVYINPKGKVDSRSTNEITLSMTEQLAENAQSNFIYRLGTFPEGTYYFKGKIEILEGTDINKKIVANVIMENYILKGQLISNGKESDTINLTEETALNIAFYIKQDGDTDNSVRKVRFYDLQISKEDVEYEPFKPAMPSLEYPSEIKAVGDNGSANIKVNNGNIAKINETNWELTENNTIKNEEQEKTIPVQQPMLEGDYFDLEREKEVHNWEKKVLNGTENWLKGIDAPNQINTSHFALNYRNSNLNTTTINTKCENLKSDTASHVWNNDTEAIGQSISQIVMRIESTKASSVEELKTYLQENPITVYVKKETPTELDLTEEQKIALKQQLNSYEGTTYIFSEDEVSPIFDVTAYAKIVNTSGQVQSEPTSEPSLDEEVE